MRTTLNISDDLLKELFKYSQVKSKTKAIYLAIEDFVKRKKIEHLTSLPGNIAIDYDWEKEEQIELNGEQAENIKYDK